MGTCCKNWIEITSNLMTTQRELREWRKKRNKFQARKREKTKSSHWLLIIILSISVLSIVRSWQTFFDSSQTEQSLLSQSVDFPSIQYQPIRIGLVAKIANHDFTEIDRLAATLDYQGKSVEELAVLLSQNAQTEMEKARIIYAWIAQHISYDIPAFLSAINNANYPDVSPEKVLGDRTSICSGYSNLYFALAEAMDLEAVIIFGYAKGITSQDDTNTDVNHAWNGVKIDGNWYLLDATWGAGSIIDEKFTPQYKPYYFATQPSEFIYNHFPVDRGWQILPQVYSREQFANLPNINSRFYSLGLKLVSHNFYQIKAQEQINIEFQAPANVFAIADLYQGQKKLANTSTFINRKDNNSIVSVAPPATGDYELKIYANKGNKSTRYQQVITYQIEAAKSVAQFPKTYGHFSHHQAMLMEPLESNLPDNRSVYFSLKVPNAIDVQVINTTTNQWTALEDYGDYFQGYVEIKSGKNIVVAKFSSGDRYWHLVEYNSPHLGLR